MAQAFLDPSPGLPVFQNACHAVSGNQGWGAIPLPPALWPKDQSWQRSPGFQPAGGVRF
ncbi:hypothetical protein SBA4_4300013 [Candidatus Sulfopaludibacter sp. SbA4]|nr:hypothetical protein SBA4_4300013 [Candidatus Sulfopaludibacter sp. SbA4]